MKQPLVINSMYSGVSFSSFKSRRAKVSNQTCLLKDGRIVALRLTLKERIGYNGNKTFSKVGNSWHQI